MMEIPKTEIEVEDDILEMVPDFCSARKFEIENISQYLKINKFEAIAEISHIVKGIARPYGFPTLETLYRELETAAKAKDAIASSHVFAKIKDYAKSYLL